MLACVLHRQYEAMQETAPMWVGGWWQALGRVGGGGGEVGEGFDV